MGGLDIELGPPVESAIRNSAGEKDIGEEGNKQIQLQIQLLGSNPTKRIPRWMVHYRKASYIIYGIIACYSIAYLLFIGVHQANPRFQIQYSAIVRYLEYNSYSILSPLLCPLLVGMLAYQVKYKIKLDEGDFFGVLGTLLFLALLNFHDGWGILKILNWNRNHDIKTKAYIEPPGRDDVSRNDMHWQYAWSTRTVCARNYVRDLQYKYEYSKKHVVRQIIFQDTSPIHRSGLLVPKEAECNLYHNVKSKAKIRDWMKDVQNEFKCCGPYGYKEWVQWFDNEARTGCSKKWINPKTGDIRSCFDPVTRWLDHIMVLTVWIMMIQGVFYIITIFLAGIHHSVMKMEEEKIEKRYSLLSMTDNSANDPEPQWWKLPRPADKPVIVGEYPPRPKNDDVDGKNEVESISPNAGTIHRTASYTKNKAGDDNASDGRSSRRKKKGRGNTSEKNSLA